MSRYVGKSELIYDSGTSARWHVERDGFSDGWMISDLRDGKTEKFEKKSEALEYIRQITGSRILRRRAKSK